MKRLIILTFLLVVFVALSGVIIMHNPPLSYVSGEDVMLQVDIQEPDSLVSINKVFVYFKPTEAQDYTKRELSILLPESGQYNILLPGNELADNDIVYFFEIEFANSELQRYPAEMEGEQPFTLYSEQPSIPEEKGFILLSTEGDFAQIEAYILAVSYYGIANTLDLNSIEVWVNGKNVTKKAMITENALVYRKDKAKSGIYKAYVTAVNKAGDKLKSPTFETQVSAQKAKVSLDLFGNFNFIANVYDYDYSSGLTPLYSGEAKDEFATWLDFFATYGKLNLSTNVYVSSNEKEYLQPVNRYRIGVNLGALSLRAGDYSPHISPLVMSNRNIRGLYGMLGGKYIGLEVAGGEMVRQTLYKTDDQGLPLAETRFKQEALGARFRLGNINGLSLGFNVARNRDIISSLEPDDFIRIDPTTQDTLFVVAPQDNMVVSLDTKINIPSLMTTLGAELAGSALNRNTYYGPISSEEIAQYIDGFDYIHPEDLASIFVINKNMEPLIPSISNCALNAYLRSYILNNLINVNYSVTGPVFNSLSTWSQQQDTKVLSISDMFNLGRFLFLSGGYNLYEDNYSLASTETTFNTNWYVQSTLRLFKTFNFKAGYFNTDSSNEDNPDVGTALEFVPYLRNSNSLMLGFGFNSGKLNILPYQFDITYRTGMDNSERNTLPDYENKNNSISFSMYNKLKQVPLKTQFSLTLANQDQEVLDASSPEFGVENNSNLSLFAKVSYSLLSNKLLPFLQYRTSSLSGDQSKQSYTNLTLGLEAYPLKNMSINTEITNSTYKNKDFAWQNYDTLTWRFTFGQRF